MIALGAFPFVVAYSYISEQMPYKNSPHLSTLWNKGDAELFIEENTPLRQKFTVSGPGLDRLDVRLAKGDGKYTWSIKKDPLSKESIDAGVFKGGDVQNYDFISLKMAEPLNEYVDQELWLLIERTDQSKEQGVAAFLSENSEDIVFQLYYRRKK